MSYESRIIIADVHRERLSKSKHYGEAYYAEVVIDIRLGCMGYNNGWRELFTKEIDFDICVDSEDKATREDKYGTVMKEGSLETIIQWLKNQQQVFFNQYRRIAPLIGALEGFDTTQWEELHVVHYGY